MGWVGVGQSDVGRRRKNNEDAFVVDDSAGLYLVSDGMGGQAAGEVASGQAVTSASEVIRAGSPTLKSRDDAVTLVTAAVSRANLDVHQRAKNEPGRGGMGCTLTLALVRNTYAVIGHVGDSRCYLYRDGLASCLTVDHTVVEEMRRAGHAVADAVAQGPFGNSLSRYVGMHKEVRADVFAVDLLPGDKLLLCSDGLSRYVDSEQWLGELLQADALDAATEELVEHALAAGGRDNITVVLVGRDDPGTTALRGQRLHGLEQLLASTFLFQGLSRGLLIRVLGHTETKSYQPGEVICEQDKRLDRLYMVLEGELSVLRKGALIGQLVQGEHTGATALLHPRPSRSELRAAMPCTVATFNRRSFWQLCKARPRLGVNLMERLVHRLSRDLDDSIERRDDGDATTSILFPYQAL